jgi:hypothetical protein
MRTWTRRVRGAIGTGLTWAVAWGIAGVLIGVASVLVPHRMWDVFLRVFDAPLPALAVPGFVGGVLFSVVLGVAGRHRRFDELSLPRFAAWGAVGGLLLSLVPVAMVAVGLATLAPGGTGLWRPVAVIGGPFMLLGALSAGGSLLLARRAGARSPDAVEGGERDLLEGGDAPEHAEPAPPAPRAAPSRFGE